MESVSTSTELTDIDPEHEGVVCTCPCCNTAFMHIGMEFESSLDKTVELEGGALGALEHLEELRLTLKSFMTPRVLDAILALYKALEEKPLYSEMFSWFVRNSQFGGECRYALGAAESFKKNRLDRTIELLEVCLSELKGLR